MTPPSPSLRHSLSFRLSLIVAAVIFAAVMCAAVAVTLRDLRRAADARADMIEAAAGAYAGALAAPLADKDRRAALDYMRGLQDLRSVISMALKDKDGGVLARIGAGAPLPGNPAALRRLEALDLLDTDRGAVSMPVVKAGVEIGSIYIVVDITDLRADLFATLGWASLVGLVAIGGGLAAAQLAISRATRPLRDLAGVMSDLASSLDLTQRAEPLRRRDEAGVLVDTFNRMLDRIQRHDELTAHDMERLRLTFEERTQDLRAAMAALQAGAASHGRPTPARAPETGLAAPAPRAGADPLALTRPGAADDPTVSASDRPGAASDAQAPANALALIDAETVATLAAEGARSGRDLLAKVWSLFLAKAPDAVFKLETLAAGSDPAAFEYQSRALKALALSAGALRLSALCERIERQGAMPDEAGGALSEVRPALELTCAHMAAYLADRAASAA